MKNDKAAGTAASFDISALRKQLSQNSEVKVSLSEPSFYLDSGNLALNYAMTGNFVQGIPNRRSVMLAGPSGTGKSYLAGNFVKQAQLAGYFIFYIETEDAIDQKFMKKLNVSLESNKFQPIRLKTVETAAETVAEILRATGPGDKVMLVVDSLANLATEHELEKFDKRGELSNDMGIWNRRVKQLIRDINFGASDRDMFVIYTNHTYQNQDLMNGRGANIVRGGDALLYLPSITWMLTKTKLKEDTKRPGMSGEIIGINLKGEILKSRFAKLGTKVEIELPYDRGMSPVSGVKDFFIKEGLIEQTGGWFNYKGVDGKPKKFQGEEKLIEHYEDILAASDELSRKITENE